MANFKASATQVRFQVLYGSMTHHYFGYRFLLYVVGVRDSGVLGFYCILELCCLLVFLGYVQQLIYHHTHIEETTLCE